MKKIKYKFISHQINKGTRENPVMVDVLKNKSIDYSKANEEIAKREAYNGEYTIEDDGQPEPATVVSTDDVLDAMLGVM